MNTGREEKVEVRFRENQSCLGNLYNFPRLSHSLNGKLGGKTQGTRSTEMYSVSQSLTLDVLG